MTTISMRQKDIRPAPARIDFKGMKFLITDRPSDANMQTYLMVIFACPFSIPLSYDFDAGSKVNQFKLYQLLMVKAHFPCKI